MSDTINIQDKNIASDYLLDIAISNTYKNKVAKSFNILGRRSGFTSTSVYNDVKEYDNTIATIATLSNSTLDIISSSASDGVAGTGVRSVKVCYLNTSNVIVESGVIALNGTTLVTSVLTGVNFIYWMESYVVGSGGVAAGNIRLRINGGVVECEQITLGGNKSRTGAFKIPTGYTGYVTSLQGTAINTSQDILLRSTVNTLDRTLSTAFHYVDNLFLPSGINATSNFHSLRFPELSIVKVSTLSGALPVANRANISFSIILIAD